jgi:hypothetical protein
VNAITTIFFLGTVIAVITPLISLSFTEEFSPGAKKFELIAYNNNRVRARQKIKTSGQ